MVLLAANRSSLALNFTCKVFCFARPHHGLSSSRGRSERQSENCFPHTPRSVRVQHHEFWFLKRSCDFSTTDGACSRTSSRQWRTSIPDDVLIYAETQEQLLKILDSVLKRLTSANLKCKASKCFLFSESVHYSWSHRFKERNSS